MKKQVVVIGLGQFGMGLVRKLSKLNAEVIGVDVDEDKIQQASSFVEKVYCFDATQEESLARLSPASRDVCICATGDQSKEAAIICTALLKQFGAKRIIARANDDLHSRILKLVGAHEVINPEWEFGAKYANRIVTENVLEQMSLGSDLLVSEIKVPAKFTNQTILDLNLRKRFGITVIAMRNRNSGEVTLVQPDSVLNEDDILVVVSTQESIMNLMND